MNESVDSYLDIFAACDDQLSSDQVPRNVYVVAFCLILIFAVPANGSVLCVIFARKLWRDVSVVMIGNLAVSDIFLCVSVLVPEISKWVGYWEDSTYTSLHLCRIHVVAESLFPTVTILSLVVMSFERCRISRSKVYRRRQSSHRLSVCYLTLLLVWAVALATTLPIINVCLAYEDNKFYYADDWGQFMTIFVLCRFIFIYVLPLVLIACFYSIMAVSLNRSLKTVNELAHGLRINTAGRRAHDRRRRLTAMVFSFVVAFAVGWLPFYLFRFLFYYGNPSMFCTSIILVHMKNFRHIFFCLLSLANPCLVYIVGANFRKHLREMFCGRCYGRDDTATRYRSRKTTVTFNAGSWTKNNLEEDQCIRENDVIDL